jgi:hypothetical protein
MATQGADVSPLWQLAQKIHCNPLDCAVEISVAVQMWNNLQDVLLRLLNDIGESSGIGGHQELEYELNRLAGIMEARISARTALFAANFAPTNTLTWENDTFKKGVLKSSSRGRRFLLHADTLVQALKSITVTQKRMEQCCQEKQLIIMLADIDGRAWQLRKHAVSNTIGPHPFSEAVPGDKVIENWKLLMVEVNWDMHLASVRHIWKAHGKIQKAIKALTEAIQIISDIHKNQHQLLPARFLRVVPTNPLVIWLSPEWRREQRR